MVNDDSTIAAGGIRPAAYHLQINKFGIIQKNSFIYLYFGHEFIQFVAIVIARNHQGK